MASNSSFYTSSGQTETITANVDELKADAEKLAINPEDEQYTLSDETTTGYSALHYAAKAEEHKDDAETAKTAAETAKTGAETAKTAAEAAYNNIQPNITNINTVAGLSTEITALGASDVSADIQALADSAVLADMDALADIADDISEAATAAGDITTVAHLQDGTDATDAISDLAAIDTDITAVAGKATEIGRLGTADAVADLAALGTAAVVSDLSTVADRDTDIGTVAAADSNIASVAGQISPTNNISTVAGISSDISAVAGKTTEIGRLGTADAVADLAALGTASMVADLATVADRDADIATVASRDADIATVADRDADIGTVADRDADIGTLASNNANITTVASNISGVNSFAERYRTGTTDPTTDNDEGDLFYNQTTDDLKVWTGSAWEAGVTAGSGFLATSGGTMTGALTLSGAPTANLHAATKQYVDDNGGSNYLAVNSTGTVAYASGTDALSIGEGARATGNNGISIGVTAEAIGQNSISIGSYNDAGGQYGISIGFQADADAASSVAIGRDAYSNGAESIALGKGANCGTYEYSMAFGDVDITANAQVMFPSWIDELKVGTYTFNTDQTLGASQDGYVLTYNNTSGQIEAQAADGGSATGNTFVAYAIGEPAQDYVEEKGVHSVGVNNNTENTVDFTSYTYFGSTAFRDHQGWDGFADGDFSTGAATTVGHTNTYADAVAYIQNDTGSNIVLDDSNMIFRDGWAFYNGSSNKATTGDKVDFIISTNGTTDNSADYLYKITFTQNGSTFTTWTNSRVTNLKNYTWNNGTKLYAFFKKNGSFSAAGTIYGMSPTVNWNFSSETEEYTKELVANSFSYTKNTYNSAAVTHTWYGISTESTQPSDNATGYAEFDWHEIDPDDPPSFDFLKSQDTAASTASGNDSIALGARAVASGYDDISIGADSDAVAGRSVVIGTDAQAYSGASYSVSIGKSTKARNSNTTAVGGNADVGGNYSTAIGAYAKTNISGSYATAIGGGSYDGDGATVTGNNSTAIGASTYINGHTGSIAIGYNATTSANNQMMLGTTSGTGALSSIRVANSSYTPSVDTDLATKKYVDDNGGGGFDYGAVNSDGTTPTATGIDSIAIGESAVATNDGDICIGLNAHTDSNSNEYSISIGRDAGCAEGYSVALGTYAEAGGITGAWGATAVGAYADATTSKSVGIGYFARATNNNTVAVGDSTQASAANATALGRSAIANGSQSTSVGSSASAGGYSNSASLGYQATSNANNTVTLGNSSITSLRCQDTTISAVSDYRDKTQIEDLSIGLDYVNSISPKAYYKNNRANYYDDETNEFDQSSYDAATQKHDKREFGFIAQDVAAELPVEYADARVSFAETEAIHGYEVQRFAPADMLPILWKAVQELSAKNEALEARITALENA